MMWPTAQPNQKRTPSDTLASDEPPSLPYSGSVGVKRGFGSRDDTMSEDVVTPRLQPSGSTEFGPTTPVLISWDPQRLRDHHEHDSKPRRVKTRRDPDVEWIRRCGHEFPAQWVAVCGGRLIAHGPEFEEVSKAVRREACEDVALVTYLFGNDAT